MLLVIQVIVAVGNSKVIVAVGYPEVILAVGNSKMIFTLVVQMILVFGKP